jgi:hypothetical protein
MNLLRHRRERLALRAENEVLRARLARDDEAVAFAARTIRQLRAERDQAEAELRALRGEVA